MISFLDSFGVSRQTALLLIDLAWKSTLLLSAAGVITLALRHHSAALRHAVWHWTLVALLLLPAVAWLMPGWGPTRIVEGETSVAVTAARSQDATPVRTIDDSRPAAIATADRSVAGPLVAQTSAASTIDSATVAANPIPFSPVVSEPDSSQSDAPSPAGFVSGVEHASAAPHWPGESLVVPRSERPRGTSNLLITLWIGGYILVALPLIIGIWRVERLRRRSLLVNDPSWRRLLSQVAGSLRLQTPVELKASEQVAGPMAGGVWKPFVLLPEAHQAWPEDRSHSVLLHELAHIARRDVQKQWLAHLACMMYWLHPLAWFAAWRLRVERERACDDAVLALGTRASDYSQHLLEIAAAHRSPRWMTISAMTMARSSQLRDRIERILDPRRPRSAPSLVVVTLLAVSILAMAGAVATAGRVIVRDAQGNVVASVDLPDGGSVSLEDSEDAAPTDDPNTSNTDTTATDPVIGMALSDYLALHDYFKLQPQINAAACDQCHQVDDWSQVLLQRNYCPTWPHGVVIDDADQDGVLDLYLSQSNPSEHWTGPQQSTDSEEMYRRLMLDLLGRPPTAEEMQSLLDREEAMRRELMQSVAEELLNQLQSQAPSEATDAQIESWRQWMEMIGEPTSDPDAVNALWRELLADPPVDVPVELEEQTRDDMSEYEPDYRSELEGRYGAALSEFDALARRVGGDPHYPQSSGLLPASVEQPRGLWQIETVNPRGPIIGLELSSNGRFLAMANSGVVRIFDFDRLLSGYASTSADGMQQIFAGIPFYNDRAPLAWEPGADTADGGWLAAGTCEGSVRLLKFDGTLGPVLQTDDPIVVGVCWSPDGKFLAAAGYHGQVTIWDRTWQRVHEFRSSAWLSSIDWKPDGTQILLSNLSHGLEIWTPEGTHVRTIETPAGRNEVAKWSDDGSFVASTSSDPIGNLTPPEAYGFLPSPINSVRDAYVDDSIFWIWTPDGELHKEFSVRDGVPDMRWDNDAEGNTLQVVSRDCQVLAYNVHNSVIRSISGLNPFDERNLTSFAMREHGALAFGDAAGNLYLKRAASERFAKITGNTAECTSIAASPYGELTAISGESSDGTGFVSLINAGGEIETHLRLPARVNDVTWSPDGMFFIPVLDGEPTRIWKRDGTRLGDLGPGVYDFIAWHPTESSSQRPDDGRYVAAAAGDQRMVFDVSNRGEDVEPMPIASGNQVTSLSWSPVGEVFFTGSANGTVTGCNEDPSEQVPPHNDAVRLMAWSPDGASLATACGPNSQATDTQVRLWDYELQTLTPSEIVLTGDAPVIAIAWSHDSQRLLVTRGDNSLGLYSADGQLISSQMLFGVMAHDAAWDPNNDRFAIGTSSGAVEVMRPDGTTEFTLRGHTGRVIDIEWSPTGDRITAIAEDGTARCWNSSTGEAMWIYVPAGPEEAITLRPDGVLLSRLEGTPDSAFVFVGGSEEKRELHQAQFGPEEMIWVAIEVIQ